MAAKPNMQTQTQHGWTQAPSQHSTFSIRAFTKVSVGLKALGEARTRYKFKLANNFKIEKGGVR